MLKGLRSFMYSGPHLNINWYQKYKSTSVGKGVLINGYSVDRGSETIIIIINPTTNEALEWSYQPLLPLDKYILHTIVSVKKPLHCQIRNTFVSTTEAQMKKNVVDHQKTIVLSILMSTISFPWSKYADFWFNYHK